jgi:hypothetical protein
VAKPNLFAGVTGNKRVVPGAPAIVSRVHSAAVPTARAHAPADRFRRRNRRRVPLA